MNSDDDTESRADRIARAREALAARYAADPTSVERFKGRMANLEAARKRERQRVDHLVLGQKRPTERRVVGKKAGRRKPKMMDLPVQLPDGVEQAVALRERWNHKTKGTPETWEAASRTHQGSLAQLHANGTIDNDQLESAAEIANVYRSLQADVAIDVASLEAKVDASHQFTDRNGESVRRVRMHLAYGYWREALPQPKQMVLDMVVGDTVGFTVAAKRYRVHNRRAKRELISALDRWPSCVDRAYKSWSDEDIQASWDAIK